MRDPKDCWRSDHRRRGLLQRRELRVEKLPRGGVSGAAEFTVQLPFEQESLAKHLRNGED